MYVFIATIFIAELIITGFIISLVLKCDKKVNCAKADILNCGTDLVKTVIEVRNILKTTQNVIGNITGFFTKKKVELRRKMINLVLIYAILFVLKIRFKKAAAILQYGLILKDFWTSIPA